ncbi:regulation of nuclear pre-mRNA domain-containing protein 1B [Anthonomus grandis grandis]|uniref:regulation of nuclear pre-mRNA domain-containing protein 1B n=1 Tax=Anthonomus grandis grandis TaxID=2921223 RepID=UPI0021663409|nr:regulation of nuclear pre-mRNA domain-containing protein 1B [Anthonomus grandis grandis]
MSGGFTESAFIKKLTELNNSSQSIQTLSLWLIHHRKHYTSVVKIWVKELIKAKENRKLTFMYLANDVIQNSKKKGPEYGQEFGTMLKKAFEHMSQCDEKTKNGLDRLLTIWQDRGIYSSVQIMEWKRSLVIGKDEQPPSKRAKTTDTQSSKKKPKPTVEVNDGETRIHLSPHTPPGDPPEPEELIKAIQELDANIASSDEKVREKIANLPKELSDVSTIAKIEDRESAERLSAQVTNAVLLLSQYNTRLSTEMDHRKKVAVMMRDFLQVQEELLAQAERSLEEYQESLSKVLTVRHELQSHIQNLPDLTQLPNVTHGLAPLPSAENLFMP